MLEFERLTVAGRNVAYLRARAKSPPRPAAQVGNFECLELGGAVPGEFLERRHGAAHGAVTAYRVFFFRGFAARGGIAGPIDLQLTHGEPPARVREPSPCAYLMAAASLRALNSSRLPFPYLAE